MRIFAQIIALFISGVLVSSCFEDPDCINLRNHLVGIRFKKLFDGKLDTLGAFGITVSNSDSVFSPLKNISELYLPLDVNATQQTIDFNLLKGDFTLVIDYQSQPQFESVDCGPRFILSDLGVSLHNFDSVRVTGNIPLAGQSGSNIDIFRCPITHNFKIAFRQLLADDEPNGTALTETLNGISLSHLPFTFFSNAEAASVILPLNSASTQTTITINDKVNGLSTLNMSYTLESKKLFDVCGSQNFIHNLVANGTTN